MIFLELNRIGKKREINTFLRSNLDELEPLADALISAGFIISKEHTKPSSTLNRAPALSNSPP